MKKWILIATVVLFCFVGCKAHTETDYQIHATVIKAIAGEVLVETEDGNVWGLYADGFSEGQSVRLTMDPRGTRTHLDDFVIGIE